jgi:hypothetical protein
MCQTEILICHKKGGNHGYVTVALLEDVALVVSESKLAQLAVVAFLRRVCPARPVFRRHSADASQAR